LSIFLIIILCIVYNVWYNNYKDKQKRGIQLNLEKMKMEARKRMKILGIHEPTIAQFVEEGKISFSGKSYLGAIGSTKNGKKQSKLSRKKTIYLYTMRLNKSIWGI